MYGHRRKSQAAVWTKIAQRPRASSVSAAAVPGRRTQYIVLAPPWTRKLHAVTLTVTVMLTGPTPGYSRQRRHAHGYTEASPSRKCCTMHV
jgi:hypothetical protein